MNTRKNPGWILNFEGMESAHQDIDRIGRSSSCPLSDFSQVEVAKY